MIRCMTFNRSRSIYPCYGHARNAGTFPQSLNQLTVGIHGFGAIGVVI